MSDEITKARKELDKEFAEVRKDLGEVHVAFEAVMAAGAEDDIHGLLDKLESEVKEARDGGVLKSGANDHRRARKKWKQLTER